MPVDLPPPSPEQPRRLTPGRGDKQYREMRRELISDLLGLGATRREMKVTIEQQLGIICSLGAIEDDVAVVRDRWVQRMTATFQAHVSEQMHYYDMLLRAAMPQALNGDDKARDHCIAVLDRRAKLVGMDQPDKLLVAGVIASGTPDVPSRWSAVSESERDERTVEMLGILNDAGVFVPVGIEGGGMDSASPDRDVIDVGVTPGG